MSRKRNRRKTIGYSGIGLLQPKFSINVGSVLRAAGCFGAKFVAITGRRYTRSSTDTPKAHRYIPLFHVDNLKSIIPFDCVPVAVEILPGATLLPDYNHPDRAFYIFGPEDGSIPTTVLNWCRDVIHIPAFPCLNLAAATNVVLYDRAAKQSLDIEG